MSKAPTTPAEPTDPKLPRGRGGTKPSSSDKLNQATTEDMEREELGVAAKE